MPEPHPHDSQVVDLKASDVQLVLHGDGSVDLRQPWGAAGRMKVLVHPADAQEALWAALALRRAADHLLAAFPALEG